MVPMLSLALGLAILLAVVSLSGGPVLRRAVTEAAITLVVVIGIYIFVGNSGVISFGHIVFMMLGAYASAWQTCCPGLKAAFMPGLPEFLLNTQVPLIPAVVLAGLAASLFAVVVGAAIMRLSGIAAAIASLALLAVMKTAFEN